MENKPQNVFEKLDNQSEKIDDISKKLEGISIEDLYALAKRTWDYEDYQTAQKYYNHISLLKPSDWEAPLYASLCNFKGSHDVDFWNNGLEKKAKVLISTIIYVNNLSLPLEEKNYELDRCIKVIIEDIKTTNNLYYKNKDIFDKWNSNFVYSIEMFYAKVYNETLSINHDSMNELRECVAKECLIIMSSTKKIAADFNKDLYNKFVDLESENVDFNYDEIIELEQKKENFILENLSEEEKKEVLTKCKIYFEFNDKVISQKKYKFNLILGVFLMIISISGIVLSFFGEWYWVLPFIISLLNGILFMIKAFKEKNIINISSLLCGYRVKLRLSSNGDIVTERAFNIMKLMKVLSVCLLFAGTYMAFSVLFFSTKDSLKVLFFVFSILNNIINCFSLKDREYPRKTNGKFSYYYKGNIYYSSN